MKRSQRMYPRELKIEAVKVLLSGHKSPSEVSRIYGTSRSVLYNWVEQYQRYGELAFLKRGGLVSQQAKIEVPSELPQLPPLQTMADQVEHLKRVCGQQASQLARQEEELALLKKAWRLFQRNSATP